MVLKHPISYYIYIYIRYGYKSLLCADHTTDELVYGRSLQHKFAENHTEHTSRV